MIFKDRAQAGKLLSSRLLAYKNANPIILALPRGGVPIAAEIARSLSAPLEVLITRKIGAPFQSELAVGAICEESDPYWNDKILFNLGLNKEVMKETVLSEKKKIADQILLFRNGKIIQSLSKRTVIVVDDGLATGATMSAAVKYLKKAGVTKIIVAVPVSATSTMRMLRAKVDDLIVLQDQDDFTAVGFWYEDFSQVTDEDVLLSLKENNLLTRLKKITVNVEISVDKVKLHGELTTFPEMKAMIVFVHGSGSSRNSPRNKNVADKLNKAKYGTLLFDLLTEGESENRKNIFDIELLSKRLLGATRWLREQPDMTGLPLGYFGASTGAAAAIQAAAVLKDNETPFAIVSRGGRPDLAGDYLEKVSTPTLLIVGSHDYGVDDLNRNAQKKMHNTKISFIEGATHLFEEPGALEEVAKQSVEWFEQTLKKNRLAKSIVRPKFLQEQIEEKMVRVSKEDDYDQLVDSLKDKRVVMLGEATHGTAEFYRIRSTITRNLIRDHGFKFVAVEGDWPDAYRLDRYIRLGIGESAKSVLMNFRRWPTWMWANEEIAELAEWMRASRAGFYGLDVYSLFESIDEVVRFFKKSSPELAREIEDRYSCFDRFSGNEIAYSRSLLKNTAGYEAEVLLNLQKILSLRIDELKKDGEELFNAKQNARVIANAEAYYRAMLDANAKSWNVRDVHMMDTLDQLLDKAGEDAKAIVWAHNTHIGDYRATDMKAAGYVNLGGLARLSYGEDHVALVGFGTYEGEVLAGQSWGHPEEIMPLAPAREDSYEFHFHSVARKNSVREFYVLLDDIPKSMFSQKLGHRAVGVVFNPQHENRGNYVPTILSKRYDAFIFVDRTHALKSLHVLPATGEFPETWPSGQ